MCPELLVETLVGDFRGRRDDVDTMVDSAPDVFAHNIEVTRRLTPKIRDPRCDYDLSLGVLARAKERAPERFVKSSIMVGIGESDDEIVETLADLRKAGVDIVTLGQYLRPTPKHASVDRYVTPEQFSAYEREAQGLGFAFVASGPLVRSSYHAAEGFVAARLKPADYVPTSHSLDASKVPQAEPAQRPDLIPATSLVRARALTPRSKAKRLPRPTLWAGSCEVTRRCATRRKVSVNLPSLGKSL